MTTATFKRHSAIGRFGIGFLIGILGFGFGLIALIIPPIGILILLMCAAVPFVAVMMPQLTDTFSGQCPVCRQSITIGATKASGFDCKHCKQRIMIRDQHFISVAALGIALAGRG